MSFHTIVYRSVPLFEGSVSDYIAEVDRILVVARKRNPLVDVTGALLFNEDWFVQLLEGSFHAVMATYHRIALDPRHEGVELLHQGSVEQRRFPDWSMGFVGHAPALRARFTESPLAARGELLRGDAIAVEMVKLVRPDLARAA